MRRNHDSRQLRKFNLIALESKFAYCSGLLVGEFNMIAQLEVAPFIGSPKATLLMPEALDDQVHACSSRDG
jgi:hypothetical protein